MSKLRVPKIPWVWAWGAVVLAFPWSNAFMSIGDSLAGAGDLDPNAAVCARRRFSNC